MNIKEFLGAVGYPPGDQSRVVVLQVAPGLLPSLSWRLLVDYGIELLAADDIGSSRIAALAEEPGLWIVGYESDDVRYWRYVGAEAHHVALVDGDNAKQARFRMVRMPAGT